MKEEIKAVRKELEDVKADSFAFELLKDQRRQNKRQFTIILVLIICWFLTGAYLIYILNDIGTVETTQEVTQDSESGNNNFIGNDGEIVNGETDNQND